MLGCYQSHDDLGGDQMGAADLEFGQEAPPWLKVFVYEDFPNLIRTSVAAEFERRSIPKTSGLAPTGKRPIENGNWLWFYRGAVVCVVGMVAWVLVEVMDMSKKLPALEQRIENLETRHPPVTGEMGPLSPPGAVGQETPAAQRRVPPKPHSEDTELIASRQ